MRYASGQRGEEDGKLHHVGRVGVIVAGWTDARLCVSRTGDVLLLVWGAVLFRSVSGCGSYAPPAGGMSIGHQSVLQGGTADPMVYRSRAARARAWDEQPRPLVSPHGHQLPRCPAWPVAARREAPEPGAPGGGVLLQNRRQTQPWGMRFPVRLAAGVARASRRP
jgi:hypothetical protein